MRLVAEPAINHAAENPADQRRDPEQPELLDRCAADNERRAGEARRIDRRIGHRNVTRWMSVRHRPIAIGAKPSGARPCVEPRITNRNARSSRFP